MRAQSPTAALQRNPRNRAARPTRAAPRLLALCSVPHACPREQLANVTAGLGCSSHLQDEDADGSRVHEAGAARDRVVDGALRLVTLGVAVQRQVLVPSLETAGAGGGQRSAGNGRSPSHGERRPKKLAALPVAPRSDHASPRPDASGGREKHTPRQSRGLAPPILAFYRTYLQSGVLIR